MAKKKDEMSVAAGQTAEAKKAEGDKKYARLPDKLVATLPAASILMANEKIMDLFARGKKRGRLDSAEMMDVLDEIDLDSDQMEKIYDSLEALSIEIGSEEDILPELPDDMEPPMDEIAEIEEGRRSRTSPKRRSWTPTPWWTPSPSTTPCACTSRRSARCPSSPPTRRSNWPRR